MNVTIYKGKLSEVIKQMQNDIMKSYDEMIDKLIKELEDGKDMVSNQEQEDK